MNRALVGVLVEGSGPAEQAQAPSPIAASRTAPAATVAIRRAGGIGGRAA